MTDERISTMFLPSASGGDSRIKDDVAHTFKKKVSSNGMSASKEDNNRVVNNHFTLLLFERVDTRPRDRKSGDLENCMGGKSTAADLSKS